jgi:CYTH domain-containing protein
VATEIEYEKTYLARRLPEGLNLGNSVLVRDVYIPESADHASLRLRAKDGDHVITKKTIINGTDSSTMREDTIPLELEEFMALSKCSSKEIVKRRYSLRIDGHDAEVDVFGEKLQGLVLIDFEFASEEEKDLFVMPEICCADVTQEEAIAGGYLAGKTYEDIEPILKKYSYNQLEVSHEI